MDQFDMPMPNPENLNPARIKAADEMYAEARNHLDKIIAYSRSVESIVYAKAGNADPSVIYDWFKAYIVMAHRDGGEQAQNTTMLMCAAALTRLVCETHTDATLLAELDKEIEQP